MQQKIPSLSGIGQQVMHSIKTISPATLAKLRIFVFIVIFLSCSALGAIFANQVRLLLFSAPLISETASKPALAKQRNIIIIHTNELYGQKPALISVWVVFATLSDPPDLTFKSLYPPVLPSTDTNGLADSFALTPQADPASQFLDHLRSYNFPWQGFVLVDNEAINELAGWINGKNPGLNHQTSANPDEAKLVLQDEQLLFRQMCDSLNASDAQRGSKPNWRQIIPGHFHSNFPFDTVIQQWARLTAPDNPPHCEVLVTP